MTTDIPNSNRLYCKKCSRIVGFIDLELIHYKVELFNILCPICEWLLPRQKNQIICENRIHERPKYL